MASERAKRSNGMVHEESSAPSEDTAQSVLELVPRLNRWAESRALRTEQGGDLSLRQLSALSVIEDETTTLGEVAKRLMVTPAVVTGMIDRLERRGYVRRLSGASDRRRVHLALTEAGRNASQFVGDHLVDDIAERLSTYAPDEVRDLERGLSVLSRLVVDLVTPPSASGG